MRRITRGRTAAFLGSTTAGLVVAVFLAQGGTDRVANAQGYPGRRGGSSFRSAADAPKPPRDAQAARPVHKTRYEDFQALLDRNIFNRYRRPPVVRSAPRPPSTRPAPPPPPPKPVDSDQYYVLLGVGLEGEQYTAFVEDTREGKILTVHPGQAVGRGRLLAVNLDSIHYQRGPASRVVKIGHRLTGDAVATGDFSKSGPAASGASAAPAPGASGKPGSAEPTTAPASPTSPSADPRLKSIIERMRQRRLQEMGAAK